MNQKSVTIERENGLLTRFLVFSTAAQLLYLGFVLKSSNIFENKGTLLAFAILIPCSLISILLCRKKTCFLYISDNHVCVSQKKGNQDDIRLPLDDIAYFETRFNEVIIYDTNLHPHIIRLDFIRSEKKRWEVKELLRQYLPQNTLQKIS